MTKMVLSSSGALINIKRQTDRKLIFHHNYQHDISQKTFDAEYKPTQKISRRSDAMCIHRLPATLTRSSVHLVGGSPTERLLVRGLHSRTFLFGHQFYLTLFSFKFQYDNNVITNHGHNKP